MGRAAGVAVLKLLWGLGGFASTRCIRNQSPSPPTRVPPTPPPQPRCLSALGYGNREIIAAKRMAAAVLKLGQERQMPWSGKNPMTVAGSIIWGIVQLEQVGRLGWGGVGVGWVWGVGWGGG
jgi:hypothetical protein